MWTWVLEDIEECPKRGCARSKESHKYKPLKTYQYVQRPPLCMCQPHSLRKPLSLYSVQMQLRLPIIVQHTQCASDNPRHIKNCWVSHIIPNTSHALGHPCLVSLLLMASLYSTLNFLFTCILSTTVLSDIHTHIMMINAHKKDNIWLQNNRMVMVYVPMYGTSRRQKGCRIDR